MSAIMAASGEIRWRQNCFQTAATTSGRLRGGDALEVEVRPHIAENPGGLDLRGPVHSLHPLLRAICCPRLANVSGNGYRSGPA